MVSLWEVNLHKVIYKFGVLICKFNNEFKIIEKSIGLLKDIVRHIYKTQINKICKTKLHLLTYL